MEVESSDVEMPSVVQEDEKPKSETGKAIERERDAAIKRRTLSLDERMNDFKEMLRERAVSKNLISLFISLGDTLPYELSRCSSAVPYIYRLVVFPWPIHHCAC